MIQLPAIISNYTKAKVGGAHNNIERIQFVI